MMWASIWTIGFAFWSSYQYHPFLWWAGLLVLALSCKLTGLCSLFGGSVLFITVISKRQPGGKVLIILCAPLSIVSWRQFDRRSFCLVSMPLQQRPNLRKIGGVLVLNWVCKSLILVFNFSYDGLWSQYIPVFYFSPHCHNGQGPILEKYFGFAPFICSYLYFNCASSYF